MLPEFELLRPRSLREALLILADCGPDVRPVAGGTNVIVELRNHAAHRLDGAGPRFVLDLGRVDGLRGLRLEDGPAGPQVVAGGLTTIAGLLRSTLVAKHASVLHDAALHFANPLIRNRATLGGNLADASPAADTAPPLLALGAKVELSSASGVRWLPLSEFFVDVRMTARRPDELLTAVRWPAAGNEGAGAYTKIGLRKADAISVLSAAVWISQGETRIGLGAVYPTPFRPHEAEALLADRPLNAERIAAAARSAGLATRPISDIRATAAYRRQVTEVVVRRLLTQAAASRGELSI